MRQKAQALAAVKPEELESKAEEAGLTVAQDSYGSAKMRTAVWIKSLKSSRQAESK